MNDAQGSAFGSALGGALNGVLVFGTSIPALSAALELAEVGVPVWIGSHPGALPRAGVLDVDAQLEKLLTEIATPVSGKGAQYADSLPVHESPSPVSVRAKNGEWKRVPEISVWGIPAVPLARETLDVLGAPAAWRAYLDRVKPVLTIGKEENLATLVRNRVGAATLERLVEPLVYERFGVVATRPEVTLVAPGLNEALTRAGSLSGAAQDYFQQHVARETTVRPGGGWEALRERMLELLALYGAQVLDSAIEALSYSKATNTWAAQTVETEHLTFDAIIVGDAGSLPAAEGLSEPLSALAPTRHRTHVEIGISAPRGISAVDAEGDLVELASDSQGETWSLRARELAPGDWRLTLASAAHDGARCERCESLGDSDVRQLAREFGYTPTAVTEGRALFHEILAAPFIAVAERDAERSSFAAWTEHNPTVVIADEALLRHDTSAMLAAARDAAVSLRRRLVGIAE